MRAVAIRTAGPPRRKQFLVIKGAVAAARGMTVTWDLDRYGFENCVSWEFHRRCGFENRVARVLDPSARA